MNPSEAHETLLADRLFGALSDEEQAALEAKLRASEDVRATLQELQATLRLMAERRRPEPPPAFWDGYYDRLAQRIEHEARTPKRRDRAGREGRRRLAVRTSVAAALVLVGVGIGWMLFGARTPQGEGRLPEDVPTAGRQAEVVSPEEGPEERTSAMQSASLDVRAERYLDRSKVLLLGLVNTETEGDDLAVLGLSRKQEVAVELVQESAALQADLDSAGQARLRDLVADLEVVLLQIANLEAEHDLPTIELVRQGVDRRALLLQINLAEMRGLARTPPLSDSPIL